MRDEWVNDVYPSEEELEQIKNWDRKQGYKELIDLIQSLWWHPELGFKLYKGRNSILHRSMMKLELHTNGWFGNQEIIKALQDNLFWLLFWEESRRGGHYHFEIPLCWMEAPKEREEIRNDS